jgi:hypothetical protein
MQEPSRSIRPLYWPTNPLPRVNAISGARSETRWCGLDRLEDRLLLAASVGESGIQPLWKFGKFGGHKGKFGANSGDTIPIFHNSLRHKDLQDVAGRRATSDEPRAANPGRRFPNPDSRPSAAVCRFGSSLVPRTLFPRLFICRCK